MGITLELGLLSQLRDTFLKGLESILGPELTQNFICTLSHQLTVNPGSIQDPDCWQHQHGFLHCSSELKVTHLLVCFAGWCMSKVAAPGSDLRFSPICAASEAATLGSDKLALWKCACCPRGQPPRWTAAPCSREGNGGRCAVCAGCQACTCNSLESLFPSVVAEFDVEKIGCSPSEVTLQSNKKVWRKNAKWGSWMQAVDQRTDSRLCR